jgi:hypothetical protein
MRPLLARRVSLAGNKTDEKLTARGLNMPSSNEDSALKDEAVRKPLRP